MRVTGEKNGFPGFDEACNSMKLALNRVSEYGGPQTCGSNFLKDISIKLLKDIDYHHWVLKIKDVQEEALTQAYTEVNTTTLFKDHWDRLKDDPVQKTVLLIHELSHSAGSLDIAYANSYLFDFLKYDGQWMRNAESLAVLIEPFSQHDDLDLRLDKSYFDGAHKSGKLPGYQFKAVSSEYRMENLTKKLLGKLTTIFNCVYNENQDMVNLLNDELFQNLELNKLDLQVWELKQDDEASELALADLILTNLEASVELDLKKLICKKYKNIPLSKILKLSYAELTGEECGYEEIIPQVSIGHAWFE